MEYRRDRTAGGSYFFTLVTFDRRPILIDNIARLRQAFRHVRQNHPFSIEAIVILPDHLHAMWSLPEGHSDYSTRWHLIKRFFSIGFSNSSPNTRGEKAIWQKRFWEHRIRDSDDWRHHADYIHYNPVKHGYVQSPIQWRYSSFHRFLAEGIYSPNWGESEPSGPDIQTGE